MSISGIDVFDRGTKGGGGGAGRHDIPPTFDCLLEDDRLLFIMDDFGRAKPVPSQSPVDKSGRV